MIETFAWLASVSFMSVIAWLALRPEKRFSAMPLDSRAVAIWVLAAQEATRRRIGR